ncbi:MAG: hypothetical protein JJW01_00365 [Alphaproteobacteria bacterium]|nr:hypothetical protein [Rickettsiales bacterium]
MFYIKKISVLLVLFSYSFVKVAFATDLAVVTKQLDEERQLFDKERYLDRATRQLDDKEQRLNRATKQLDEEKQYLDTTTKQLLAVATKQLDEEKQLFDKERHLDRATRQLDEEKQYLDIVTKRYNKVKVKVSNCINSNGTNSNGVNLGLGVGAGFLLTSSKSHSTSHNNSAYFFSSDLRIGYNFYRGFKYFAVEAIGSGMVGFNPSDTSKDVELIYSGGGRVKLGFAVSRKNTSHLYIIGGSRAWFDAVGNVDISLTTGCGIKKRISEGTDFFFEFTYDKVMHRTGDAVLSANGNNIGSGGLFGAVIGVDFRF